MPIAPSKLPYLGLVYQGNTYHFRVLPFGLNLAPRIFTKLVTYIVRIVLNLGIFILAYLSDLLVATLTPSLCAAYLQTVLRVLGDHG